MGLLDLFFSNFPLFAIYLIAIVYGITIHEFAHCYTAFRFGDDSQIENKRLTLNPFRHIDPIGLLTIVFFGIGWGKTSIIDPYKLDRKHFKLATFLISIAGISFNILSALFFALILKLALMFNLLSQDGFGIVFFVILIQTNVILAVFNIIPIHPLDGAKIVDVILPERFNNFKYYLAKYGSNILFALLLISIIFNISIFSSLYNPVIELIYNIFGLS